MTRKLLLGLTVCGVALSGCASPNGQSSTGQTIAEGGGLGALAGALGGGLFGGTKGALIGAVGGGLLGSAAGGYVAQQKSKYASIEQRIADERELAAQATATAQSQTNASAERLHAMDAQLAALQQMRGDRSQAQQTATAMLTGLERQRAELEVSRSRLETRISDQQNSIAQAQNEMGDSDPQKVAQLAGWKADIPAMQSALAAMTQQISDVNEMETKVQQVKASCC